MQTIQANEAPAEMRAWPGKLEDLTFEMQVETGHTLADRVLEGVKALPRRGLEIGGLLLGHMAPDRIVAQELRPVESQYPDGPIYRVPVQTLAENVAAAENVVGIYRSRTDGALEIDAQDESMLRLAGSSGQDVVVLLVSQKKDIPAEARLGLWREGRLFWSPAVLRLNEWLRGVIVEAPLPDTEPDIAAMVHSRIVFDPPEDLASVQAMRPRGFSWPDPVDIAESHQAALNQSQHWTWGLVGSAAAITLTLAGWAAWTHVHQRPAEDASRSRVLSSPASQSPTPARTELPAVSEPFSSAQRTVVITPQPSALAHPQLPATQVLVQQPETTSPARRTELPLQTAELRQAPRRFAPPPLQSDTSKIAGPVLLSDVPRVPVETAAFQPARMPSVSAAIGSGTSVPLTSAGHSAPSGVGDPLQFQPPALIHQPVPVVVPPDLRRLLRSEVVLQLRVAVDRRGSVRDVLPITFSSSQTEDALIRAYSSAVRSWIFEPAKRNGQAAEGETVLSFRISPRR